MVVTCAQCGDALQEERPWAITYYLCDTCRTAGWCWCWDHSDLRLVLRAPRGMPDATGHPG